MSFADASAEARRAIGWSPPQLPTFIPAALLGHALRPVTTPMQALRPTEPVPAAVATDPDPETLASDAAKERRQQTEGAVPSDDPFGRLTYLNDNGMAPAARGFARLVAAASLGTGDVTPTGQGTPQDPSSLPLSVAEPAPLTPDFDQPTEPPSLAAEETTEAYRFTLFVPSENRAGGDTGRSSDEANSGSASENSLAGLRTAALGQMSEADPLSLPVPEEAAVAALQSKGTDAPEAVLPQPLKPLPLEARLRPELEPRPEPRPEPASQQLAALVPLAKSETPAEAQQGPVLSLPTTMVARKLPSGKIVPLRPVKTVTPNLPRQALVPNPPQQATVQPTVPQHRVTEETAPRPRVEFPQTAHLQPGLYGHATPRRVPLAPRQGAAWQAPAQPAAQPRVLRLRLAAPPKPERRPFSAEDLEIDLVPGSKADRLATFLEGVSQAEAAGQARSKQPVPFARVVSNATQARSGTGVSLGRVAKHTISRNEQARREDMVRTLRSLRTPSGLAF